MNSADYNYKLRFMRYGFVNYSLLVLAHMHINAKFMAGIGFTPANVEIMNAVSHITPPFA